MPGPVTPVKNQQFSVEADEALETSVQPNLPVPGQAPPVSRKYFPALQTLAVLSAVACVAFLVTSSLSFRMNASLFFPCTVRLWATTIWATIRLISLIGVLVTSFRVEDQFLLISATAIAIPFLLGDIVVMIFCAVWYPRPIAIIGRWVFAMDILFILLQVGWLIIGCLIIRRNLNRAENRAQDHALTTSALNEQMTVHNPAP